MARMLALLLIAGCATATAEHPTDGGSAEGDTTHRDAASEAQHDAASGSAGSGGSDTANPCSFTGDLATWDLTGQTGSEVQVVANTTTHGVVAGALTRSAAITASTGSGSINSTNWPSQATLDATKYYKLTIAPPPGCAIQLTGLSIDLKASGTGPALGALATSADAFATTTSASTAAPSTPSLTATGTTSIELRIYGYSASSTGGTLRIQSALVVHGSLE